MTFQTLKAFLQDLPVGSPELITVGSVVKLKSGGPKMTVVGVGPGAYTADGELISYTSNHILCCYFINNAEKSEGTFPIKSVELVKAVSANPDRDAYLENRYKENLERLEVLAAEYKALKAKEAKAKAEAND